jgi:DNA-binding XRE family transcriptional regulator
MRWTGDRVVRLRDAMGLTRKELAQVLKIHWFTIGRWERDEFRPGTEAEHKLDALLKLALQQAVEEQRVASAVLGGEEGEPEDGDEPEDEPEDEDLDEDEDPDEPEDLDEEDDEEPTEST